MRFYNTLSRSIEEFKPIHEKQVNMYTCGPTVYDFMHIGNLRTFLLSDLLQRILEFNGFSVTSVQNITDIDDKIIKKAKEQGISVSDLTKKYEEYFLEDIKKLNIKDKNKMPHATEYIGKMQEYIKELLEKELAYKESDGSVYFDISEFKNYGKLSGIDSSSLKTGTRILSDEYTKENIQDFALWKAEGKDEFGYDSPWGWGRPGWHIECSVMSQEALGDTFDIHAGGVDLIFPHHENEIAQSEGKTGKKFVNYFVHGAHILVDSQKMSKSLGNFYRLKDVTEHGFDPLALRYLYLQTHWRQEMNFSWEALSGAQTALNKLRRHYLESSDSGDLSLPEEFEESLNDDLNTSKALSIVWENIGKLNKNSLNKIDEILGLDLKNYKEKEIETPENVKELLDKREEFRKSGKFEEADRVRAEIESKGYLVEDTKDGARIKKPKT